MNKLKEPGVSASFQATVTEPFFNRWREVCITAQCSSLEKFYKWWLPAVWSM